MNIKTTVIGSYPPAGNNLDESRKLAVDDQLRAGIDFISDGQVRCGFRELFLADLKGISRRGGKFLVAEKLARDRSIAVNNLETSIKYTGDSSRFKGILTGPLTLAFGLKISPSAPYETSSIYPDQNLLHDLAQAQSWIINEYNQMGLSYIQIDEPSLGLVGPWEPALEALENLFTQVNARSVLHICGGLKMDLFEKILGISSIDVLAHEFAGSPKNLKLVNSETFLTSNKKLSFGCVHSANQEIEKPTEICELVQKVPLEIIELINPDCGLRNLPRDVSFGKLKNLSRAAEILNGSKEIDHPYRV